MTAIKSRHLLVLGLALTFDLSSPAPVYAVDIENRDRVPRDVTVNRADGSSDTITVKAGGKVANICDNCVILTPTSSVETRGETLVRIEGGKVSLATKR